MKHLFIFCWILFSYGISEAKSCPPGEYLVRSHHRSGYTRADGTVVRATEVKAYCKALTKGFEYLKPRIENGIPKGWPHKTESATPWKADEETRIIDILDDLPDELLSQNIKGIYRLQKSKDYPNPASNADGVIVLYNTSFDSSHDLARVLAHELSHQNFRELADTAKLDYRRAAGWQLKIGQNREVYWEGRKNGYVEEDGKISAEEDYANNIEYYLFNSDTLKKVTPGAYEWIKSHFGEGFRLKGGRK